jgi:hypothetical protein
MERLSVTAGSSVHDVARSSGPLHRAVGPDCITATVNPIIVTTLNTQARLSFKIKCNDDSNGPEWTRLPNSRTLACELLLQVHGFKKRNS